MRGARIAFVLAAVAVFSATAGFLIGDSNGPPTASATLSPAPTATVTATPSEILAHYHAGLDVLFFDKANALVEDPAGEGQWKRTRCRDLPPIPERNGYEIYLQEQIFVYFWLDSPNQADGRTIRVWVRLDDRRCQRQRPGLQSLIENAIDLYEREGITAADPPGGP